MEASRWLPRPPSPCWITSPPFPIHVSTPRCCIHYLKSCCWCCPRRSPGRMISSRRRCGGPASGVPPTLLPLRSGIPSHDTLCDVFAALDPQLFKACFLAWVSDLRDADADIIAIDGKTSRRSHDRRRAATPCISSPPGRRDSGRHRSAGSTRAAIERDHRDSAVAEHLDPQRRPGHYGCDGDAGRIAPLSVTARRLLHVVVEELARLVCDSRSYSTIRSTMWSSKRMSGDPTRGSRPSGTFAKRRALGTHPFGIPQQGYRPARLVLHEPIPRWIGYRRDEGCGQPDAQ